MGIWTRPGDAPDGPKLGVSGFFLPRPPKSGSGEWLTTRFAPVTARNGGFAAWVRRSVGACGADRKLVRVTVLSLPWLALSAPPATASGLSGVARHSTHIWSGSGSRRSGSPCIGPVPWPFAGVPVRGGDGTPCVRGSGLSAGHTLGGLGPWPPVWPEPWLLMGCLSWTGVRVWALSLWGQSLCWASLGKPS